MSEGNRDVLVADRLFGAKIFRYFLVGGSAALTEWGLFALFHFRFDIDYILAAVIAFFAALAVNYALSLRFVFVGGRHRRELEVFLVLAVSAIGVAVNLGVLALLVEVFSIHTMLAKIAGTGTAFFWNFFSRHWWIFHRD